MMPNQKLTATNLPKACKILPKWRNFAKSGHTADDNEQITFTDRKLVILKEQKQREAVIDML